MKVKILDNLNFQTYPLTDDMVEIDYEILKQIGKTKQFSANGGVIDYVDYKRELTELKTWFADVYTYQEQKYHRLNALNKLDDDGIQANVKLLTLYEEAEIKRKRIQELELLI